MRLIASVVALFLLLASLEAWAGFWILGRWYVSSRYASVSLQTVRNWLDRGIINRSTEWAKIAINRYGKWILLTIGLSEVIREIDRIETTSQVCYQTLRDDGFDWVRCFANNDGVFCYGTRNTRNYFTITASSCYCLGYEVSIPAYSVYRYNRSLNQWEVLPDRVPVQGRHLVRRDASTGRECYYEVSLNIQPCPFTATTNVVRGYPPFQADLSQKRRIPVRAYPNPLDFIRPDVVEADPSLRWLRDEYNRIARDSTIPQIPADLLGDLELPSIDWSISPDEALNHVSESSRDLPREGEGSREGDLDIPGLDTKLEPIQRKPFPVELLNNIIQNHPLLRVLQGITFDAGSGGSCQVGSGVFTIDFCNHGWVLNLMGAIIVPISFLIGLFGWRND